MVLRAPFSCNRLVKEITLDFADFFIKYKPANKVTKRHQSKVY